MKLKINTIIIIILFILLFIFYNYFNYDCICYEGLKLSGLGHRPRKSLNDEVLKEVEYHRTHHMPSDPKALGGTTKNGSSPYDLKEEVDDILYDVDTSYFAQSKERLSNLKGRIKGARERMNDLRNTLNNEVKGFLKFLMLLTCKENEKKLYNSISNSTEPDKIKWEILIASINKYIVNLRYKLRISPCNSRFTYLTLELIPKIGSVLVRILTNLEEITNKIIETTDSLANKYQWNRTHENAKLTKIEQIQGMFNELCNDSEICKFVIS